MKARKLVANASLGPEALKVAYQAFDEAWAAIAGNFGSDPIAIEAARLNLANAILSLVAETSGDIDALRDGALRRMASGRVQDLDNLPR